MHILGKRQLCPPCLKEWCVERTLLHVIHTAEQSLENWNCRLLALKLIEQDKSGYKNETEMGY